MLSKGPGQTQVSIEVLQITNNNVFVNDLRIRATVYIIPTEAQLDEHVYLCICMTNVCKKT